MTITISSKMRYCCAVVLLVLFSHANGLLDRIQDNTIEATVQALTLKVEQLQQSVAMLQNQNANHTGPVAFTATLLTTLKSLGQHQQIVFDHVITNIGNGYNRFHGHFTAPKTGVYIFFVTLTNVPGHSSSVQLLKNGQQIGQALADDNADSHATSTIAVTVELQQGDQVWVQNAYSYSASEILDGYDWSMFSGHLIGTN